MELLICVCVCVYIYICVYILSTTTVFRVSLVVQMVKNLPAMQETQVQSLGQKDPLEKGMTTHSSILAWTVPWTEEPSGLQSMGLQRCGHDWVTNTCFLVFPMSANDIAVLSCNLNKFRSHPSFFFLHSTSDLSFTFTVRVYHIYLLLAIFTPVILVQTVAISLVFLLLNFCQSFLPSSHSDLETSATACLNCPSVAASNP